MGGHYHSISDCMHHKYHMSLPPHGNSYSVYHHIQGEEGRGGEEGGVVQSGEVRGEGMV